MASVAQSNQRNAAQERAARLSYLRNVRFATAGFPSNGPVPSLAEARKMAGANARLFAAQRPQPSVTG